MTYSTAQIEPLAQRMVQALPGLDIRLARVWIQSESGANNNPLGVTSVQGGVSKLNSYPSPFAGIDAAIALIKNSSYYSGIRKAIAGGSISDQAKAIIASPWNARNSPYYTRVFTNAGFLGTTSTTTPPRHPDVPSGGASTPITQPPSDTSGTSLTPTQETLKKLGISTDPNYILKELDVWKIRLYATGSDINLLFNPNDEFYKGYAKNLLGKPVSKMIADWKSNTTYQQSDFSLPDIPSVLTFLGVILVGITFILTGGLIALKGKSK